MGLFVFCPHGTQRGFRGVIIYIRISGGRFCCLSGFERSLATNFFHGGSYLNGTEPFMLDLLVKAWNRIRLFLLMWMESFTFGGRWGCVYKLKYVALVCLQQVE